MKFALVDGGRQTAHPGVSAICPNCRCPMVPKCGEIKLWHWAHKGVRKCDPWWENETEWHRAWKNQFPADWQEIVLHAENDERHIADVKTHDGWVIEFQHSKIRPDERRSREAFYQGLIWVVDGIRRKSDPVQFFRAWTEGKSSNPNSSKRRISSPEGALLRDWAGSRAHVFFDFGDQQALWWLFPESDEMRAYVQHISRAQFVRIHREKYAPWPGEFDLLVQNFSAFIAQYETPPTTLQPPRLPKIPLRPNLRPMIRRSVRL